MDAAEELAPATQAKATAASAAPLELTPRALIVGSLIGVILSVGNGYMGLKTSFIDGGSVMAALLGFAFFATFGKSRAPFTALENNISQTVASSAAVMGYAIGLSGAIPALGLLMGRSYSGGGLMVWGIAVGVVGIVVATFLRRKLIVNERLPFPTGAVTAEVIETVSSSRETAMKRARFLVASALLAATFVWFRDGRPALIPQAAMFGGTILGVALANVTVGANLSPMMFSVGMFIGVRNALSLLVGGVIAWLVAAPLLVRSGVVVAPTFAACSGWLIWPAVGMLLASSFVPLVMDWRSFVRSFRDIPALLRRRGDVPDDLEAARSRFRAAKPLFLIAVVVMIVLGRTVFGVPPLLVLAGLVLALMLANVCARSAGETDIAPMGTMGTMTQLMLTGNGPVPSLIGGSIAAGVVTQTSQTLWAFKAGDRLRASPRAQTWAQLLGAVVGAAVAVPVYLVITSAYGIGTEAMPAPSAMSWKATAEAVRGGLSAMPPHAPLAGAIAFVVGAIMSLLAPTRVGRFLPSPAAVGLAVMSPFTYSFTAACGGFMLYSIKRLRPETSDATIMATAAGGVAGESLMGVIVAVLIAIGAL
jgi:uncharacterized oligopeptide transporter (OPT) family protein